MTDQEKRQESLLWWHTLTFEDKFYKVVEWLIAQRRDTTERHPHDLTGSEVQEIWESDKL
jgi:hypothetical protein